MSARKVVQITSAYSRTDGEQLGAGVLTILTDSGEVWEQWYQGGTVLQWTKVQLPWESEKPK